MIYGSVCSGIEAATVAWDPLGWKPAWFAEVDRFCSALLKHHYPKVRNHGDFTRIGADAGPIDLLVGGTPCQAFSVAGLRGGLDDERGNLTLEFIKLADRLRPRWLVWENVPGVFSSLTHRAPDQRPPEINLEGDHGPEDGTEVVVEDEYDADEVHAFSCFLAGLSELGYGWAYRVLDAQHFGVPQRRRRVFVVGYLGDWRRPAAVLFERHCLSGYPAPSRKKGESLAPTISARTKGGGGLGTDFDCGGGLIAFGGNNTAGPIDVASACNAHGGSGRMDFESETFIAIRETVGPLTACGGTERKHGYGSGQQEVESGHVIPVVYPILEAGARTGKSTTDMRAGMGVGDPSDPMFTLQAGKQHAIAFSCKDHGADAGDLAPTLRAMPHHGSHPNAGGQVAIAFTERGRDLGRTFECQEEVAYCLTNPGSGGRTHSRQVMTPQMAVRRLTPRECERLQGFKDNYTLIPYRGKPAADGPRYKAIGNSMAVPCMFWIGNRIDQVDKLCR
ncbi:MAG: DNA cytosine methyltransferase [Acidobacteria bacterium]|nr:DNA cytosine methyltransferase [Acidobacteriota bacterium]